ncbi:MAG: hypothetical protein WKF75_15190, partial [Singulisphaera sp.]
YIWLFAIFTASFLGGNARFGLVGHDGWGMLILPAFITLLTLCELWSGVALDSWWRARYLKGSEEYWVVLALQSVLAVVFSVFFYWSG